MQTDLVNARNNLYYTQENLKIKSTVYQKSIIHLYKLLKLIA